MEHPSGQFGSAVPALFIPSLLHTPSLLAGEQGKKESPVAEQCLHSVSQTHQCIINIVLVTNTKHSTMWAAMKKIYSAPASTYSPRKRR